MESTDGPLPLSGIRVIDAGQVVCGPMVAMLLGDFGAEVIKVEHPGSGDAYRTFSLRKNGVPLAWKVLGRNKKSVTLNLGNPAGADVFKRLVKHADVAIESFRPGTLERWGLGYEELNEVNPKLILARVSGFGQFGPYKSRPGFGSLAEAMSGFADMNGQPDGPPTMPGFALADSTAALYGALGVMYALYQRDAQGGGAGQYIDLAILEPLFSILGPRATLYDQLGVVPRRMGSRATTSSPRNIYATNDEGWVMISGSVQSIAERTFTAMGQPELIQDPRFATNEARVANAEEVDRVVGEWVGQRSRDEAMEVLLRHEVAAIPVMNIEDLMGDPHMIARETITTVEDDELGPIKMQTVLPRLSRTPGRIDHAGPKLAEHNAEIYGGLLGMTEWEMAELSEAGVI